MNDAAYFVDDFVKIAVDALVDRANELRRVDRNGVFVHFASARFANDGGNSFDFGET